MKSKPPIRISLGFEESLAPGPSLIVNRICTVESQQSVSTRSVREIFSSVREIFEKHVASEYVIVIPMTRLQDQSEHFQTEVESEAMKAGIENLVFENPHVALEREARACLDPTGVEARSPAIIVQVAVTREGEVIIAGNSSADAEIPGSSFLFQSRPVSSDTDNDSAIEAVLSEAFLFIERALSDQQGLTQGLLAAEATGISRSVMNQLHRMLKHLNVKIHECKIEDSLKGALIAKPNRPREADQHLREAEAACQAGDYSGAYVALQSAIEAYPCQVVLDREKAFLKRLRAEAETESDTKIKRFLASIESDPTRLVDIWQDIAAVEARSGSRAAGTAQLIANFIQGV